MWENGSAPAYGYALKRTDDLVVPLYDRVQSLRVDTVNFQAQQCQHLRLIPSTTALKTE